VQQRTREVAEHGEAVIGFMRFGDVVRIEMLDEKGGSVFGAIEQKVVRPVR
jgi:fumarylacetoacetate (FAA) hydrolase